MLRIRICIFEENNMHDNKSWLIEHGDIPIRYQLTHNKYLIDGLLSNEECKYWLGQLKKKVNNHDLTNIHGSHDYRTENILGKCWLQLRFCFSTFVLKCVETRYHRKVDI